MEFFGCDTRSPSATVNVSRFRGAGGVEECHLVVRPTEYDRFERQLDRLLRAYRGALNSIGLAERTAVLRRFFCSDLANQASALQADPWSSRGSGPEPCAVSWTGQPPAPPAKVMLWAYHINDPKTPLDKSGDATHLMLRRGALGHHWTTGMPGPTGETSSDQTSAVFEQYDAMLRAQNLSLAEHVVRTWLFVRDIDTNYQGMVAARREFFRRHGLTAETHFIASSGIEGLHPEPAVRVAMDAYAISGLRPEQVRYLTALDHLGPTHRYGVTFERGTSVAYADRKHLIISGTTSIDTEGNILYPGDIVRQLDRTLENIEALLQPAGADLQDMSVFIVYVRDPADMDLAGRLMRERLGDAPVAVTLAPVCRPGWLIELEGAAVVPAVNPGLPPF